MDLRKDADTSGAFVFHLKLKIQRCPKFWDAAPTQTRSACLRARFFVLRRSEFARRRGFARRAKRSNGAARRPIKDGAPDVELQEAAARQGPYYLLLEFGVAPGSGMQLRPRHAARVREPDFLCLGEVNSPGAEVLPGGQNARTAQRAAPSKMGPPTWSCKKQQRAGGLDIFD